MSNTEFIENREFMLTTKDNPYNPWTNYDDWFAYDMHPRDLTYRVINEITSFGSSTKDAATNVADTGSRFSEVIQNRYHSQDMTEPHPN